MQLCIRHTIGSLDLPALPLGEVCSVYISCVLCVRLNFITLPWQMQGALLSSILTIIRKFPILLPTYVSRSFMSLLISRSQQKSWKSLWPSIVKKLWFVSFFVTKPAVAQGLWLKVLSEVTGQEARWSHSLYLPRVSAQWFLHQLHNTGVCLYPKQQTLAFRLKISTKKTGFPIAPLSV